MKNQIYSIERQNKRFQVNMKAFGYNNNFMTQGCIKSISNQGALYESEANYLHVGIEFNFMIIAEKNPIICNCKIIEELDKGKFIITFFQRINFDFKNMQEER